VFLSEYNLTEKRLTKMNKIKIQILLIVALSLFGSCKDWLSLKPENGVTLQEYWQSEKDVKGAVMGIYASMLSRPTSSNHSIPELIFEWGELRADMTTYYRVLYDYYFYLRNGDINAQSLLSKWNAFYRTINYCNTLLEQAPGVMAKDASFTQEKLNQYRSEALAVRALLYFYLTKTFGEVPLVLEATTSDQAQFRRAKSTRQEISDQIIKDLSEAEKYAVINFGNTAENKGRITLYTIKTIQADVYLWTGANDKCIAACNAVINSGQFNLLERSDTWFSNLYVNKNSNESIFELQYNTNIANPMYAFSENPGYYRANVDVMDFLFPSDPYALPDSLDIRGDKCSFRSSKSYSIWKYTGLDKTTSKTTADIYFNFIIYRYAEVLLMKAEALAAKPDGTDQNRADALALIKQIRSRAHATAESNEETPNMDSKGLLNFVLSERAREFAFEGKRWFDILRFTKRDNYGHRNILESMVLRSAPSERMVTLLNKYQDTLFHYMPIPQSDIDAGYPDLIQNPYYSNN
jgi:starch-binding outer membrane protein, SusD/RagB family